MWYFLYYVLVLALLAGVGVIAAVLAKSYFDPEGMRGGVFGGRSDKRLNVVEQSSVDGRRKLVLVRRDRVEHLIMTGGPVDVVIETNISNDVPVRLEAKSGMPTERAPRAFGKVAAAE